MRVTWEVEDGYCGKARPQHTDIDDEALAECETDAERERLIADEIQADFDNSISWCETSRD
ncbi:MAG: hypothetical protein ACYS30_19695 [Planctomycetota bacterium]|jgi:hypothetical protein